MFKNYQQLLEKIDGFVSGVMQKHPGSFRCGPGCAKCCVSGITVWRVEADNIARRPELGTRNSKLEKNESRSSESRVPNLGSRQDRCIFLTEDNLCTIYEARPVVCRLWGAPLMIPAGREDEWGIRDNTSRASDRGTLTCCDLNFRQGLRLEDLPIDDAVSAETAISLLAAVNHLYCKENGLDPTERLALEALL